jgi:hypothetical protein
MAEQHFQINAQRQLANEFGEVATAIHTKRSRYVLKISREEAEKATGPTVVPNSLVFGVHAVLMAGDVFNSRKGNIMNTMTGSIMEIEMADGTRRPVTRVDVDRTRNNAGIAICDMP